MRKCLLIVLLILTKSSFAQKSISKTETITLGGGCFWCIEAVFENLEGVVLVQSGYSGGSIKNPTYEDVSDENSGFAEVVQIKYDTSKTNLDEILKVFFTVHDPTQLNKQGNDIGKHYRSVIFYNNDNQKKIAIEIIESLTLAKVYKSQIVTTLESYNSFSLADKRHQNYYENNKEKEYCQLVIQPKIDKFEKVFKDRIKKKK
jgi:peptide-methionine (S)-S-oxide reductase